MASSFIRACSSASGYHLIAAHYDVVIAAVAAGRAALVGLHRQNQIADETLHDLERDLDLEERDAGEGKRMTVRASRRRR